MSPFVEEIIGRQMFAKAAAECRARGEIPGAVPPSKHPHGIAHPNRRADPLKVIRMADKGVPQSKIAQQCGISAGRVSRIVNSRWQYE